jgi:CubicO group peptidase (beta-lactamase class C family)
LWHRGFGVTSVEKPWDPVGPDTLLQIASCTKLTAGLLTMQLVEKGILDLDAPVGTYVPWLRLADRGTEERITLLLNTESGNILSTDVIPKLILDDVLELPDSWEQWETGSPCLEADTFSSPFGAMRFVRNGAGVIGVRVGSSTCHNRVGEVKI